MALSYVLKRVTHWHGLRTGATTLKGLRQISLPARVIDEERRLNQPKSGNEEARYSGIATMLRLPYQECAPEGLDVCFVGIPLDVGCSNRSGTRHGPRHIRHESSMIRAVNNTGACPFQSLQAADIGDVPVNSYNIHKSMDIIKNYFSRITNARCTPLTLGGDHSLTLPILRALKEKHGTMGLVQVDAHHDLADTQFGEKIAHGTPFRRAIEEELIDPKHFVQIGLRGQLYKAEEFQSVFQWAKSLGVRMVFADECWYRSLRPLMDEVRHQMRNIPVYLTFDIDGIDPSICPGTGTPEIAGLTPIQALEIIRGCRGLNLVGGDVVEVNPLFDHSGSTGNMAANLLFEMLSVLPGVKYVER